MQIKIALCDDEKISAEIISGAAKSSFQQHGIDTNIEIFYSTKDLENRMRTVRFDLLLLDIDMPDVDGIAYGRKLREENNFIDIIYISNREDRVFEALRVNPRTFIRKSCFLEEAPRLAEAYIAAHKKEDAPTILVHKKDFELRFPINDIIYIEGSGRSQLLYTKSEHEPITINRSMGELEAELSTFHFLRIHKGFLVNYQFIQKIGNNEVLLTTGTSIPISRRKIKEIREEFLQLMMEEQAKII